MEKASAMEKGFYRPTEVATIIGFGKTMTYRLIREGKLKTVNVEGNVRVPASAIREFMARYESEAKRGKLA